MTFELRKRFFYDTSNHVTIRVKFGTNLETSEFVRVPLFSSKLSTLMRIDFFAGQHRPKSTSFCDVIGHTRKFIHRLDLANENVIFTQLSFGSLIQEEVKNMTQKIRKKQAIILLIASNINCGNIRNGDIKV